MTNNIEDIQKCVKLFSKSNSNSFQSNLFFKSMVSHQHEDILQKNYEAYYQFIRNQWYHFIQSISIDEFYDLKEKGILSDDFLILQKELENPTSDSNLSSLAIKYGFPSNLHKDWHSISSQFFLNSSSDENLFLAIHSKPYDLFKIIRLFHKNCVKRGIPCHYQFYTGDYSIDNFVIWSEQKNFSQYVDILKQLEEQYPNLFSRCQKTSLLTKSILPYVGYGEIHNQSLKDFYSSKSVSIYDSIQDILWKYIQSHYEKDIFPGQSIIQYLSQQITLEYIKQVNLYFLNPSHSYQDFYKKYHFFLRDIQKKDFYQKISLKVRNQLIKQLRMKKSHDSIQDILLSYQIGWDRSHHVISKELIYHVIQRNAKKIFDSNPSLYEILQTYLDETNSIDDSILNSVQQKKIIQKRK